MICDMLEYQIFEKNVWGVKIFKLHQMGHENFCAFSEISSAPVCAIINDCSLNDPCLDKLTEF